jgi:hypothetical protein
MTEGFFKMGDVDSGAVMNLKVNLFFNNIKLVQNNASTRQI